jgi:hypothetical protein
MFRVALYSPDAQAADGARALARGLYSFRVVSECPVVIVLFFQVHFCVACICACLYMYVRAIRSMESTSPLSSC